MKRSQAGILALLLLLGRGAAASVWSPFGGYVDLARVDSEIDGQRQDTFRREINGNFHQTLLPAMTLDLGMRYYRFDQDLAVTQGSYREEIQPSGQLRWRNPWFLFVGQGLRRRVITGTQEAIVTRDLGLQLQSVDRDLPLVRLGWDDQRTFYPDRPDLQDVRNRRFRASADYARDGSTYAYGFLRQRSENVISGLTSLSDRHNLRWSGRREEGEGGRLRLTGSLSSQFEDRTDEVPSGGTVLERVAPVQGLFARDDAPEQDPLEPVPGLIDGDTEASTEPAIDIGGGNVDINLGMDLGAPVPVAGIYVYADRPSGDQVSWSVWVSEDDLSWQQWTAVPVQVFNPALNRYEITFTAADFRYVKVVNAGLNEVAQVFVTEIEVLRQRDAVGRERRQSWLNQLDGRATFQLSRRWRTSLDGSLQDSEYMGRTGDRTRTGLAWRLDFTPSRAVSHHLRLDYAGQRGNGDEADQDERSASYSLAYRLAPGWRGSASANRRSTRLDGEAARDISGVSLENRMDLLPGLDLRLRQGISHSDDHLIETVIDSWTSLAGLEASPRRNLDLSLSAHYQESATAGAATRVRCTGVAGLDWRPGSRLYLRMNLQGITDRSGSVTRDILMGWNILSSLKLSGQAYDLRTGGIVTTRRYSLNLNLDLTSSSYLYIRFAQVDLTGGGGAKTTSFQQGFRAGF